MGRVKLEIPNENPLYSAIVPVRITDINYGGHVGNDAFLSILHEARVQMLASLGYSELNAGGNSLIMADVAIAYKNESFYGDFLHIDIFSAELTSRSFELLYRISTTTAGIPKTILLAKTGMVCFDYAAKKVALMTEELKEVLEGRRHA